MAKPGLGRGLGALLSGGAVPASSAPVAPPAPPVVELPVQGRVQQVTLKQIRPSPLQPRKDFPAEALQELADSIREQGIVQPLIVRAVDGHFELIAGERRWRAAQLAGLDRVPVLERTATDAEVLELALIENLQRENLNPVEEALGYQELAHRFSLTQEEIARKVGRSRAAVANALRLLKLPAVVQTAVREGRLSVGHAKVLLGLPDSAAQTAAAERVLHSNLSVRETEELIAQLQKTSAAPTNSARPVQPPASRDPHVTDLESRLRERLGTRIALRYRAGRGALEIRFTSDDELNRVLELLGVQPD